MDLDDLLDEPMPKKTTSTVAQKKSNVVTKFAAKKDEFDDFDDSYMDEILGDSKPAATKQTFGGTKPTST